ncbi:WD40-repeat-containing domain protein [Blyttiomyces helicus]|uniref:WD40-repeat-containing domain protein n=1 Tax=Blyttiomyces helicus TaxID=388810 RepID=A0A4P9WIK7_9FUNG|nr:WD40-repeat-containing domain protein [Blyttiomyces helicus]|eukprot:RKO91845.1 WD40-repeat-containing domain protein [Blyttiomyces helicus]
MAYLVPEWSKNFIRIWWFEEPWGIGEEWGSGKEGETGKTGGEMEKSAATATATTSDAATSAVVLEEKYETGGTSPTLLSAASSPDSAKTGARGAPAAGNAELNREDSPNELVVERPELSSSTNDAVGVNCFINSLDAFDACKAPKRKERRKLNHKLQMLSTTTTTVAAVRFDDEPDLPSINIPPTWSNTKATENGSSQTDPVEIAHLSCQTVLLKNEEVQTDTEPERPFKLLEKYDYASLMEFLRRVENSVSVQLLHNIKSTAFDGYSVKFEEDVESIACIHTLAHGHRDPDMLCTEVAWNKTGLGRYDHVSWCNHKGMLSFHPEKPHIIAGGTFNAPKFITTGRDSGEIIIWSTAKPEDPVIASSTVDDVAHQEPVAKIAWVTGPNRAQMQLVSIGNDGKVLVWNMGTNTVTPAAGSQLLIGNVPRHLRSSVTKTDTPLGGTALSFSKENAMEYIAGTEGGYLLKCTTANATPIAAQRKDGKVPKLSNPVLIAYSPHVGPVQSVACSPFHRNLFLSTGSDGNLRLYSALQPDLLYSNSDGSNPFFPAPPPKPVRNTSQAKSLLTWEPSSHPLYCAEWSPARPTVFACTAADGFLYIYDLVENRSTPVAKLASSAKPNRPITALSFCARRLDLLATGDADGAIRIWRLSTALRAAPDGVGWRELAVVEELAGGWGEGAEGGS